MSLSFLKRPGQPDLAYEITKGARRDLAPIVFLPGYKSDMYGTKAMFLSARAAQTGQAVIRFDYSGHGQSQGRFEEGTIGRWLEDALAIFDAFVDDKAVIVGSSMGGWIGLLLAAKRPEKLKAFIGIAAAPDFTRDILKRMTPHQRDDMRTRGFFSVQGDYAPEPLLFTRVLLEDGERNCILDKEIPIDAPVRLLQGRQDTDVPWAWAYEIANKLRTGDKKVIIREEGDHRLSTDEDLAILAAVIDEVSK